MAHFAKVNKQTNLVVDIVVVDNKKLLDDNGNEIEQNGIDFLNKLFPDQIQEFQWIQCSVWTVNNIRKEGSPETSSEGKTFGFRGNFPAPNLGKWYPDKQKFINPSPYPSWTLDENDIWQPPLKEPTEEQCYYGSDPFISPKEFYRFPYNSPLLIWREVVNPEGKTVKVLKDRMLVEWDESNQIWKGLHNDGQFRYWNGSSWNPSL